MIGFTQDLNQRVERSLQEIQLQEDNPLRKYMLSIRLLEEAFDKLRLFIHDYEFAQHNQEILFFKQIKPALFSSLIYFRKVYNIEINRPKGDYLVQRDYLQGEMSGIRDFFERNKAIYCYYRSADTSLDEYLFLRGNRHNAFYQEVFYFERDPLFSTCCDFKIAKIIAFERIEEYLQEQLRVIHWNISHTANRGNKIYEKYRWTADISNLVELAYAILEAGCVNNGDARIIDFVEFLGDMFNIKIERCSDFYYKMRTKSGSRTAFLLKLIKVLEDRMDRDDEKNYRK